MKNKIIDQFGRVHNYLRISLTDNCNLRCFYCMPEEEYAFTPHTKLMQVGEINQLAKIFVDHGVTNRWSSNQVLTLNEILDRITSVYKIEPIAPSNDKKDRHNHIGGWIFFHHMGA